MLPTVPLYDAREVSDFDIAGYADRMDDLPLFRGGQYDIPPGGAAAVGYTVEVAPSDDIDILPKMTLKLQWLVVFGVPRLYDSEM